MCSSSSTIPSSLSFLTNNPIFPHSPLHHPSLITFLSPHTLLKRNLPPIRSSSTWLPLPNSDPTFSGWDPPPPVPTQNTGFPRIWVAGVGTTIALLVAALARFSLAEKGFRLPFRSSSSGLSTPIAIEVTETEDDDFGAPHEENACSEIVEVESSEIATEPIASEKHQPRVISVSVDTNQQEALNVLKKLKIIEENVKAVELCSRRDYARWLLRASLLERNPKYKITTEIALSGSLISAYDDVTIGDPDFGSIQALAEAGVLSSKLFPKYYLDDGGMKFSPERFVSRRDLIDWRAQLEYDFAMTGNKEILKTKVDLLDVREITSDEWPGLLMDMLAGDKSLLRRVFGQIRRLQPDRPATVAQAAVALTSGRMAEAISTELQRLEAAESARQAAKEETKKELLERGEIQRYWDGKMEEEKSHGLEVQQMYIEAHNELEEEKSVQESVLNEFLKEKAAMDCQKQLLNCLQEEVNEMSEKIVSKRAEQIAEEEAAQTLRCELETKKEGILDAKSLLEAEIEALRILRSWIEDEARKSQARLKVLQEVGRRWKWDGEY